jgi:hypothetical protein
MEDNKLIAEFMGFPQQSDVVDDRTTAYYIGDVIKATNENNQNLNEVTDYAFQEFGPVNRYLTTDTELKGWLHLNYLVAAEESSHSLDYTPRR